ncbi:MAG: spore coat protein CotJB [Clostridia bacterium]|nr:spore coat protein CotJB [Clostridia bacterium]MBQ8215980.1 spore coat protein CotJB [Clostridia bacterium]MBQ8235247.1 spore coat protein CotJB [Clostridia bacterium]
MNQKEQLLKRLQSLEFAMVDLGQYLDTHPGCREALSYYKDLKAEHESVKGKYEEQFGPITAGGGGNADYWDWIATPWPWELAP